MDFDVPDQSLPEAFEQVMSMIASVSSLHLHMRATAGGDKNATSEDKNVLSLSRSSVIERRQQLLRANTRLRTWLRQSIRTDGRLQIQVDSSEACVCEPRAVDYGNCAR